MITKIAKVQALREAFPAQLGAMYTSEESGIKDAEFEDVSERKNNSSIIQQKDPQEPEKFTV